jgi:hypothetical protein
MALPGGRRAVRAEVNDTKQNKGKLCGPGPPSPCFCRPALSSHGTVRTFGVGKSYRPGARFLTNGRTLLAACHRSFVSVFLFVVPAVILDSTLLGILDEWYLGLNWHVSLVVSLNYLDLF